MSHCEWPLRVNFGLRVKVALSGFATDVKVSRQLNVGATVLSRSIKEIPQVMKAVQLTGHGGLEKLVVREDIPVPVPGPRDVQGERCQRRGQPTSIA